MEVLFHFIFELFKIAILASVYSTIILLTIKSIGKRKPNSWFDKVSQKRIKCWLISGLIISVALFAFMFSYWGDHGLGDSARIPIGHGKAVDQINGNSTYIRAKGFEYETLDINEYATSDDFLFAKISSHRPEEKNSEIAVWNLKTNDVIFLEHFSDIDKFKIDNKITEPLTFQDFQKHYSKYWNTWRFWLLA
jgi:hypothetical protein